MFVSTQSVPEDFKDKLEFAAVNLGRVLKDAIDGTVLVGNGQGYHGYIKVEDVANMLAFLHEVDGYHDMSSIIAFMNTASETPGFLAQVTNIFPDGGRIKKHPDYLHAGCGSPGSGNLQWYRVVYKAGGKNALYWMTGSGGEERVLVGYPQGCAFLVSSNNAAAFSTFEGKRVLHGSRDYTNGVADFSRSSGFSMSIVIDFLSTNPEEWIRDFLVRYEAAMTAVPEKVRSLGSFRPVTVTDYNKFSPVRKADKDSSRRHRFK